MRAVYVAAVLLPIALAGCQQPDSDSRAPMLVGHAWQSLQSNDYHMALSLADSALALSRNLADAHFLRGRVLFELNRFAESEEAYQAVLELDESYPGTRHNLGNALFGQEQFRRSIEHFLREGGPSSWHAAGAAYARIGQPDSALTAFHRAAAMDSAYRPVHKSLAELYEQLGQYERALEHATMAEDPYLMGLMLFHLNRFDQARLNLETVLAGDSLHHSALYTLGQIQLRLGSAAEAKALLNRATALRKQQQQLDALAAAALENPTSFAHQMAYATALRDAGRLAEAVNAWLIALSMRPSNLELQSNIATAYMQLGDTTRAIDRYRRVLGSDSTHVTALINLGWHYFRTGRRQAAVEAWARAAQHHPSHPAVATLKETLQRQLPGSAQNRPEP